MGSYIDDWTQRVVKTIERGTVAQVQELIAGGLDINLPLGPNGWPPLCCAAAARREGMIQFLLQEGAKPNQPIQSGSGAGMVALDFCNTQRQVAFLLTAGARKDIFDCHGWSPAQWASFRGKTELVAMLS